MEKPKRRVSERQKPMNEHRKTEHEKTDEKSLVLSDRAFNRVVAVTSLFVMLGGTGVSLDCKS